MRRSDTYEQWRLEAGLVAMAQRAGNVAGKYKLFIQAVRPDKRRRDIDNLIKPINDLMVTIGAVSDDGECEMVTARWVTAGEAITVRIEPAGSEVQA